MKTAIIFFAGLVAGAACMKLYLGNKFDVQLQEEIDRLHEAYEKEKSENFREEKDEKPKEEETLNPLDIKTFKSEIKKQAYESYFNDRAEEKEEETEEDESAMVHPVEPADEPYAISAEMFETDRGLDKTTLIYYYRAELLTEEDEVLDDPVAVLGDGWKEILNNAYGNVVYVRNEKLGTDYEVFLDGSAADFIRKSLGYDN